MIASTEHLKVIIDLLARNEVQRAYDQVKQYWSESQANPAEAQDALIKALKHTYHHLAVLPVHIFLRGAPEALGPALAEPMRAAFEAQIQKTDEWRESLRALGRERYARETRALIRAKNLKAAAQRVRAMVELSREDANPQSVIGYLGTTLGTLDHDQDLVDQLIDSIGRAPEQFGLTSQLAVALDVARKQMFARLGVIPLEGREREFNRVVTQAIVDLRNRMATDLAVGEPTEEEMDRFFEELHAIYRACVAIGRADSVLDVLTLLIEITPRDRRQVGPAVASEERLFLSLNPRQRLMVARGLRRLGEIPRLVSLMNKFAKSPAAAGYHVAMVEVMGGLGSREFYSFVLDCYQTRGFNDPRFSCIDALGRIQHESAADLLIRRFGQLVRAKPFDPPKRREAEAISTALGRIARSRTVSVERRNEITAQVVALIPDSDTMMGFRAARDFFTFQPKNLDQKLLDWAMGRVVQALWSQDQRPEFARAAEGTRAVLGFRQEIVDLAVQIGNAGLDAFLRSIEPYVTRFSGAFYAVGEILEKVGDERIMPVLKRLVITAWMSSGEASSKYYQETYFDTATQTVKPMSRDKIIHALLYTAGKVGGAEGLRYVVETAQQVRAKQLDIPGEESGSFLMQQLVEHGREVAEERARIESTAPDDVGGDASLARTHIQELVDVLRGRYLMAGAKRAKKIPAIQEIARRRHVESLELIIEQLSEKDPLIQSAATTAIIDFGAPGARPATLKLLGQLLLDRLGKTRNEERQLIRDLIKRLNPRREPFRSLIVDAYNTESEGGLKAELSRIIRTEQLFGAEGPGSDESSRAVTDLFDSIGGGGSGEAPEKPLSAAEKNVSLYEAKRRYFQARKAWLDGGKKGDPPVAPEGI